MKFACGVEYEGTPFYGWQVQVGLPSVQEHLEQAISYVANEPIEVIGAGRTDRGVHALSQVFHFETTAIRDPYNWILGINTKLPKTIRVNWMIPVPDDFHARFSATARTYEYYIHEGICAPGTFSNHITWSRLPLDISLMQQGAQALIGEHDFTAFRGAGCQSKSPFRCIESLQIDGRGKLKRIRVKANAFLLHMVRNISGALMAVGAGNRPVSDIQAILDTKDRKQGDITAPAAGLYFVQVHYPEQYDLPTERFCPFFWDEP